MRFLLDESADARLASHLTSLGHDATTVAGHYTPGLRDEEVLAIASGEHRILITSDRDFGELVFRLHHSHSGVI
jgi:predicted nuclease of predicted toxin-antitoxin system